MASLQASSLILSSSSSSSFSSNRINAALQLPDLPRDRLAVLRKQTRKMVEGLNLKADGFANTPLLQTRNNNNVSTRPAADSPTSSNLITAQFYAILEAVADRVEMHSNIGEQRDNWNSLLLNSINMLTLTASTMAGIAAAATGGGAGMSLLGLKLSSTLLFSAATGMLLVMNKLQPSQLAEEQRNAARLFRQLKTHLKTAVSLRSPTDQDVKDAMEKVLALDKAYPLPLLGAMIEKFPEKFEPAVWWPKSQTKSKNYTEAKAKNNGWSKELEEEMREIVEVVKSKDGEDYERLGNLALKINKSLAIAGPLLTGIAALSSLFVGNGSLGAVVAVTAGALASSVNALEHGGQVGMVIEMYRNCAGFFKLMEDSIETTLQESDVEKRENGEVFRMKVGLQLGRSLPQLKDIAAKSAASRMEGKTAVDEFASKLF